MDWLNKIVDEIIERHPDGDLLIESGASPSGTYHVGHLREVVTSDAILLEIKRRGRNAKHIHYVDDLDGLRKIPANIPSDYEKYLGKPLCDVPSPDDSAASYSEYFLQPFIVSAEKLGIEMEVLRSHTNYRRGDFTQAIESTLLHVESVRKVLEDIAGRELNDSWSPIQVMEDGYLKNRKFIFLDTKNKEVTYLDKDGKEKSVGYTKGEVKLDWRIDWPARWWMLKVSVEPFGRDHATKGGSYDTGAAILKSLFESDPPLPVPYDFINRAGDTKKMSASKGTGISAGEILKVLPPEIVRYFILRYAPAKRLYFDQVHSIIELMDEFALLNAKENKTEQDNQLISICIRGLEHITVSPVPFSHLVASYQAALNDIDKTIEVLSRTEYSGMVKNNYESIKYELKYIDQWLKLWAPEELKFSLLETVDESKFSDTQKSFFKALANKISEAPEEADGEWFHKAIYDLKDSSNMTPSEIFSSIYTLLIGKERGPRAGWFLSILPREWLIQRLNLAA